MHLKHRFFFGILALVAFLVVAVAPGEATGIGIQTTPEQLVPFEAEASVPPAAPTLCVQTIAKKNSKLHLKIQMPPETPWLSTDFPVVEGKVLLDIETPIPETGKWILKPMLPIRGDYSIPVTVCDGTSSIRTADIKLHVNENPSKYRYFAGLATLLIVIGLIGGWVIGGRQQIDPGQIVPRKVEMLLTAAVLVAICSMLALAVAAEINIHQNCGHDAGNEEVTARAAEDANYRLSVSGEGKTAVGNLSSFSVQAVDLRTMKPAAELPIHVDVLQLEEGFPVLSFTGIADVAGKVSWKQSFFDGAPHRIEAQIDQGRFPGLHSWKTVSVEAIHPSLSRRLTTFAYMIMFLLMGMLVGLLIKERTRLAGALEL